MIPIGFTHSFGDLEGTHESGSHTNVVTRLDNGRAIEGAREDGGTTRP